MNLTALNRSTTAAFDACHGKHVESGETVSRWFPGADRELPICSRCGVPFNAPKANWSSGSSQGTKRGPKVPGY